MGYKDRAFLNNYNDALYTAGKMVFLDELTPIVYLAFVVWRKIGDKEKGRVVIDLRPLNKIVIPDIYPRPNQDDIINDMRGKKYFI